MGRYGNVVLTTELSRVTLAAGRQPASRQPSYVAAYIILALYLLLLVSAAVYAWRGRNEVSERRRAAERGDLTHVRLVQPQPQPQPSALSLPLPLPLTIQLRPRWSRLLTLLALFAAVFEAATGTVLLLTGESLHDALTLPAAGLIVIVPWVLALMAIDARQVIEVSEEGLTIKGGSRPQTIQWREARVFAITAHGKLDQAPIRYELSSAHTVARWVQLRRSMPFLSLRLPMVTQPTVPFEVYERQMDALHASIATNTGLPLYDLRGA